MIVPDHQEQWIAQSLEAGAIELSENGLHRPPPRRIEATAALVTRRGRVLAVRRPPRGLLGGLWELPGDDLIEKEHPIAGIVRGLRERVGLSVSEPARLGEVEHVFTHRVLRLHVFRCEAGGGRTKLSGFDAHRWLAKSALHNLPHATVTAKAFHLALGDA